MFKKLGTVIISGLLKVLMPAIMELISKELEELLKKLLEKMAEDNTRSLESYKLQIKEELKNGL